MKFEQQNSDVEGEVVDGDEVPPQYRLEVGAATRSGPASTRDRAKSKNAPPQRRNPGRQGTLLVHKINNTADDLIASKAAPADDTPWLVRTFKGFVTSSPKRSSSSHRDERKQKKNDDTLLGTEGTPERHDHVNHTEVSQNQIADLEHQFRDVLQRKEREWMAREEELERKIQYAQQSAVDRDKIWQARIRDIQMEKGAFEEQHNALIRKQQLASIRQAESARWLPEDETKIEDDLAKLKMEMRRWSKTNSIKDLSILQTLGEVEHKALMQELSNVVMLENGQLPKDITTTAKCAMLLLNALLTDHLYMSIFRSPFFFLGKKTENPSLTFRPEEILEDIYSRAQIGMLIHTTLSMSC
jgi:hypothetical protein